MSQCTECGADLTGIKVTEWVSKKDNKPKKAVWCPNKHPNWINEPKSQNTFGTRPQDRVISSGNQPRTSDWVEKDSPVTTSPRLNAPKSLQDAPGRTIEKEDLSAFQVIISMLDALGTKIDGIERLLRGIK